MSKSKKELKKEQQKKNRRLFELFNAFRGMREEDNRIVERSKPERKDSPEGDDKVWSAKVATIRNRLNDQRRDSKERWNRFSGTSDAGARGL